MLRTARIECVLAELICAARDAKPRRRDDHVNVPTHRANRAIAILDFEGWGQIHFKAHGFAMASAGSRDQFTHLKLIPPKLAVGDGPKAQRVRAVRRVGKAPTHSRFERQTSSRLADWHPSNAMALT